MMTIETTQDELIHFLHHASKGDHTAFQQLYNRTSNHLYAIAVRMLRRRDWADDVMQEAYVRIWHNASEYLSERGSVLAWMSTILRYRAIDRLRHEKKRRLIDDDIDETDVIDDSPSPLELAELQRDTSLLYGCMEELQEEQRRVIASAFFDGYTHEQLSNRFSTPLGTVKSWVRRGLLSLRRCLQR